MKNLTWQNPEQLFVAQELINKVKSKCCGIKAYNEQGVFYIHKDYGNNEEPLYAKAIELITGTNPAPQTRSAVVNTLDGKTYKLPAIFRPGHDGMLMPARHAE